MKSITQLSSFKKYNLCYNSDYRVETIPSKGNRGYEIDRDGNRKLLKKRYEEKIDNVSALMDAFVAYKINKDGETK